MDHFSFRDGVMYAEDVAVAEIAAAVGTPVYIYSRATFERHARIFREALDGVKDARIAFAVKANPNLAVLRVMARQGYGADVVSAGEMVRSLAAGMTAEGIIFSGVGKTAKEMKSGLAEGIGQFNIESEAEGIELAAVAAAEGLTATAALRVNPDVDALTHAKISTGKKENKFGIPYDQAVDIYSRLAALPGLNLRGIAVHIGSQLLSVGPLRDAFGRVGELVQALRAAGQTVTHVDLGGGLGVSYRAEEIPVPPADYGAMVAEVTRDWDVQLMFEPGRVIAANAGVLVSEVIRVKPGAIHPFVIVDAAMNDLARPALYDSWHDVIAVQPSGERFTANIVGPICESTDTFAMGRDMDAVAAGDLVVFRTAGAYGATMASTYNSRDMVPEVMVDGDKWAVVADRIPASEIMAAERVPEWLD